VVLTLGPAAEPASPAPRKRFWKRLGGSHARL